MWAQEDYTPNAVFPKSGDANGFTKSRWKTPSAWELNYNPYLRGEEEF
jgi:hypothetical protein